jgi:lipopolysaccharide export system protein LptA
MAFSAGSASLDRVHDILTLDDMVHVVRGEQRIDTDHAIARMSEMDDFVKSMQLRGGSRVEGGDSAFDSMRARDINLAYSDDGQTVQEISLAGGGAITMRPNNGASGRQFTADSLDLVLAPDGSIEHGLGQQQFQMVVPATPDLPARRIQADEFEAHGAAGKGLTDAAFAGSVVYREEASKQQPARIARAQFLRVTMDGDAIGDATFTGGVTFQEQTLKATAGVAHYDPGAGSLSLKPAAGSASPTVADDRITIDAQSIDVTLGTHAMSADGMVKTTLQAPHGITSGTDAEGATHLPGLLKQDQPAHVNADTVDYNGSTNRAEYDGNASLWQGQTAIRANQIIVDQGTGDLTATGNARAALALDSGPSVSRAEVITYDDAKHAIAYRTGPPAPSGAAADTAPPPAAAGSVQMNGPEGDLTAARIDAFLGQGGVNLVRLEADGTVQIKVDARTVTGGHMVYHADTGEYVVSGTAAAPVKALESCRVTTGKTLTFFKSTDRIIVDGNQEIRTQTKSGGACPQPSR